MGTTGLEPATSAVTSAVLRFFNDFPSRGERLRLPKSYKTLFFVDRILDRNLALLLAQIPRFCLESISQPNT